MLCPIFNVIKPTLCFNFIISLYFLSICVDASDFLEKDQKEMNGSNIVPPDSVGAFDISTEDFISSEIAASVSVSEDYGSISSGIDSFAHAGANFISEAKSQKKSEISRQSVLFNPAPLLEPLLFRAIIHFSGHAYDVSDKFERVAISENLSSLNYCKRIDGVQWKIFPFLDNTQSPTHYLGMICTCERIDEKNRVIISYHGTRPFAFFPFISDLVTDLSTVLVDFTADQQISDAVSRGKVHRGYSNIVKTSMIDFKLQLENAIRRLLCKTSG